MHLNAQWLRMAGAAPVADKEDHERRHSPQLPRSSVLGSVQRLQVRDPLLREHEETETFEGKEYPLFKLDTSSESHPFYTGTQKSVDNMGGRVERFRNRFGKTAAK